MDIMESKVGECEVDWDSGLELVREKLHRVFVLLQIVDLKMEILGKMDEHAKAAEQKLVETETALGEDLMNINSKLNRIALDQSIDSLNIQQNQGDLTNIRAHFLGDEEIFENQQHASA